MRDDFGEAITPSYAGDRLILKLVEVCIIPVCIFTWPPIPVVSLHTQHMDSTEHHPTGGSGLLPIPHCHGTQNCITKGVSIGGR